MRILILGATGMLGHKLYQLLSRRHTVFATIRGNYSSLEKFQIFQRNNIIENTEANSIEKITEAIITVKPDVVINCIGIIKQLKEAKNFKTSIYINSLFPHLVSEITSGLGIKFIHISTDCVFSGKKGNYNENDLSDAADLYGKTKALGEVVYDKKTLTIRTSIIGRELQSSVSLLDWFFSQEGKTINGYTNAIYTGFTTNSLVSVIERIIVQFPELHGLYQISSDPISKYNLF